MSADPGTSATAASAAATTGSAAAAAFSGSVAPANTGAQASQPVPVAAVTTLPRLAGAVELTIQAQTQAGGGTVRIKLTPPELGEVRVQLSQTDAGIVARVVASHPEAAQTLQQSAGDLRRALEGSGISLAQLDIGTSDGESAAAGHGENGQQAGGGAAGDTSNESDTGETATATSTTTLTVGAGSVVNVLA